MANAQHKKAPAIDVLQGMINGILITTGKALRPNKEGGGLATSTSKLQTVIPAMRENFHSVLDDLECEIVRAKSVLLRDLNELRAKRIALENPVPILDPVEPEQSPSEAASNIHTALAVERIPTPKLTVKEEQRSHSPEERVIKNEPIAPPEEHPQPSEDIKVPQNLTPPASNNAASQISKPIGLGIITEGTTAGSGTDGGDLQNSAIDSLFDMVDEDNNTGRDLDFDAMDFSIHDSTQDQDTSQVQHNDFDLSNFGTNTQDFNMSDLNTSNNNTQLTPSGNDQNKQVDDLLNMTNTSTGGDVMNLDLDIDMNIAGDSVFDEMFFAADDGGDAGGGGEMEHGEFDNAFFGIE